ncbi:MAG TPA: hypothetical protein VFF27_00665 [Bacteroidia bacterium]|nr:hypothetical protein [Bacteroidia bacterium]
MKKSILLILCSVFAVNTYAQDVLTCDSVYRQTARVINRDEPCLLTAINYVLEHPLNDNSKTYDDCIRFILTWMDKTSEFSFDLNGNVLELCKGDNLLLFNVYLASLAKPAVETKKLDIPVALNVFAAYLETPENKVKLTSKLKKFISNVKANEIDKYLK